MLIFVSLFLQQTNKMKTKKLWRAGRTAEQREAASETAKLVLSFVLIWNANEAMRSLTKDRPNMAIDLCLHTRSHNICIMSMNSYEVEATTHN